MQRFVQDCEILGLLTVHYLFFFPLLLSFLAFMGADEELSEPAQEKASFSNGVLYYSSSVSSMPNTDGR